MDYKQELMRLINIIYNEEILRFILIVVTDVLSLSDRNRYDGAA